MLTGLFIIHLHSQRKATGVTFTLFPQREKHSAGSSGILLMSGLKVRLYKRIRYNQMQKSSNSRQCTPATYTLNAHFIT